MNIKIAVIVLSTVLLGTFGVLTLSMIKTSDLLDFQAQELTKAGESIRVAQGLKNRLLAHNRNSFLYSLHRNPLHRETRQTQRKEIHDFLISSEQLVNSKDEQVVLAEVKQEITDYLEKRDRLEAKPISPVARYNLVSQDVEYAISSIDKLVAINRSQMSGLSENIGRTNKDADQMALFLFFFGGLVLLGVVIATLVFVAHPLTRIAHVIVRYGTGETSVRAVPKGLTEIRAVSSNFNAMAWSLEEKRQDKLRFIASIAHDLRNPLSSMSMVSEVLISQQEDQELAKIIFRQVQNLDRLVGDLLDTTRIEAGHLDLTSSEQEISSLIKDSVELHRTGSDLHGFKIELPTEALTCKCDGGRLSQVMNNLLSNAIKYSPNGGTVSVKGWREGSKIHIAVSDQGIGIDPQDIENIFKPFHRTKTTKSTIPGIGLGLSASRRIVEAHGGKLQTESVLGKGSTFHIILPSQEEPRQISGRETRGKEHGSPLAEA